MIKIAAAQIECVLGDPASNTAKMEKYADLAADAGADVVVFPEMSDTGYEMETIVKTASSWNEGPVKRLQEKATDCSIAIIAGVSEREGEHIFNTIVVINNVGQIVSKYRKVHLITAEPVHEERYIKPGDHPVLAELCDFRIGLMTCYDIRFPEFARSLTLAGADIIVAPSAFPLLRRDHWKTLTQARAIENQLYFVATNRVGTDGGVTLCGTSTIYDPYGVPIGSASEIEEKTVFADISKSSVARTRSNVQAMQDRRPDVYNREVA